MAPRNRLWVFIVVLGLMFPGGGCGRGPSGEVEGVVQSQGRPLGKLLVTFLPEPEGGGKNLRASGTTDETGRYRLKSQDGTSRVPVGKYRVFFEDLSLYEAPRSEDGTILRKPPQRVPTQFLDPLQSPLRREVKPGLQTIDLDLAPGTSRS